MRRSGRLRAVRFVECHLDEELFGIWEVNSKHLQLEVPTFEFIQVESKISQKGMESFARILGSFSSQAINIHCHCDGDALQAFANVYKHEKINKFEWKATASRINAKVFVDIARFVDNYVGEFATDQQVTFDEDDLSILSKSNGSKKMVIHAIKMIDREFSYFTSNLASQLGKVCSIYDVWALGLGNTKLKASHLQSFRKHLRAGKIKEFDVRENKSLGVEGFSELGSVVSQCEVENVGMAECCPTVAEMKAFMNTADGTKIHTLNLSGDPHRVRFLDEEKLSTITEIVRQCQVKVLKLHNHHFKDPLFQKFKESIADTGVKLIFGC